MQYSTTTSAQCEYLANENLHRYFLQLIQVADVNNATRYRHQQSDRNAIDWQ